MIQHGIRATARVILCRKMFVFSVCCDAAAVALRQHFLEFSGFSWCLLDQQNISAKYFWIIVAFSALCWFPWQADDVRIASAVQVADLDSVKRLVLGDGRETSGVLVWLDVDEFLAV